MNGTLITGPVVTLWDGDGPAAALHGCEDLLSAARPPCVQIHSWSPQTIATKLRQLVPDAHLIVGAGVDTTARMVALGQRSVTAGAEELAGVARRAVDVGALAIVWDAEAAWKRPPNSTEAQRIHDLVRATLALVASRHPALEQHHTAYDHPTYHSTYPWQAWLGTGSPIRCSWPQVYAAPLGGLSAHRGALPAREAAALASWATAIRKGWIRPDAPEGTDADLVDVDWRPYYQLHHGDLGDTVASALAHDAAAFWALHSRSDLVGRRALLALCALWRLGFWGGAAVERFQAAHNLEADDRYGPMTEHVLLDAAELDVRLAA